MILCRDNGPRWLRYYEMMIKIINNKNGIINNITQHVKIIINAELGYNYINMHCDFEKNHNAYKNVLESFDSAMIVTDNNEIKDTICYNMNQTNTIKKHVYDIDDIISFDIGKIYEVLRAGFFVHVKNKSTPRWFSWNKNHRCYELFVLVIEMYSQMEFPLCGNKNIVNALNECIIIYTNDPPISVSKRNIVKRVQEEYGVIFDPITFKFKWYF